MTKVLITGDFCPHQRIEHLVLNKRFKEIYNDFYPILENNDISITNLECPLIDISEPLPKTGPNLKSIGRCIEAIKFGQFNVVTLSNNHILDHGARGLFSTIKLLEKNHIDYTGAGKDLKESSKILYKRINEVDFGILNFSENEFSTADVNRPGSNPLNPISNYYNIKSAKENAHYVIVIIHGGHEGYSLPSPRMIETYRFFIDAGADIVVGHHTHCYSGYEEYNKGLIFYSLGNFLFDWNNLRNMDWNIGYAVSFSFTSAQFSYKVIPYKQSENDPGVFLLNDKENSEFNSKLNHINSIIANNDLLIREWERFLKKKKSDYILFAEAMSTSKIYRSLRNRKYLPSFLSKKRKLLLLNLIRCESHRDLLIESLKGD